MAEVASAFITLMPSMRGFDRQVISGTAHASEVAGRTSGSRFGRFFVKATAGPLRTFGALAGGIFAVKKVGDFFKSTIEEARESQKVSALTARVIKSTGGAAKISAKQVGALATAISNKVGVDDEAIQSGSNLLLTFKNIRNEVGPGNDIFNQTTQVMTDMTAAMNHGTVTTEGLKGSAIQLGKALNDPVRGMTALTRVGVTFTDQQKKQVAELVKSGRIIEAQKLILRELNSEFKGAAAASATAGQKLSVVWGNVKEDIGTALLPALDAAERGIANALPKIERGVGSVAHFVATKVFPDARALAGRAVGFGSNVVKAVKKAVQTGDWSSLGSSLAAGIGKGIKAAFNGGGGLLSKILDWAKGVDWGSVGLKVGKAAVSFLTGFVLGLVANLPDAIGVLVTHWQEAILTALSLIPIGRIAGRLAPLIAKIPLLKIFTPLLKGLDSLGGLMETVFSKTLGRAFAFFGREIGRGFTEVAGETVGRARAFVDNVVTHLYVWADDFAKGGLRLLRGLGSGIRQGFGEVARFLGGIAGRIVRAVGDLSGLLVDAGRAVITGFWNGMKAVWSQATGWISGIAGWIKGHKGPLNYDRKLLVPHGEAIMGGLRDGLEAGFDPVKALIEGAAMGISGAFQPVAAPTVRLPRTPGFDGASLMKPGGEPPTGGPSIIVNNPVQEPASESIPRALREQQYVNGGGW